MNPLILLSKSLKFILNRLPEWLLLLNQKNKRLTFLNSVDNNSRKYSAHVRQLIKKNKTVGGYIPFSSAHTQVIIYNFFSVNYGLRSKGKILISFTDKNLNSLQTKIFEIGHREIFVPVDFSILTTEPVFCVVLLGHDDLRPNHGGLGGQLRFWGEWNNFAAFSHSMVLPGSVRLDFSRLRAYKLNLAERRIYPQQAKVVEHYGLGDGKTTIFQRGDLSDRLRLNYGYSVMGVIDHGIFSCFHNSPFSRQQIGQSTQTVEHVIAVPLVEDIEIYMYFGECCTIGSTFSVSLHTQCSLFNKGSSRNVLLEQVIEITSFDPIKLSSLFPNISEIGASASWLVFRSIHGHHRPNYINIVYGNTRTQDIYDGVHSHNFASSRKFGIARSLKFAPFTVGSYMRQDLKLLSTFKSLLVIWGDDCNSVEFRLRIFSKSDTNFEQVHGLSVGSREVKFIELNNYILPDLVNDHGLFLAQIESEQQNLNANLYCLQLTDGKGLTALAVDHLTGG